jgi:uncharacterized protein with PIN domain
MSDTPKFIVDRNVGKLARFLRLMGYDTRFFDGGDDSELVAIAKAEGRVILSRDTQIMKRRLITSGRIRAVLIQSDQPGEQIRQVIDTLNLDSRFRPFSLCLECNQPLVERAKEEVKELVPPYVFKTQEQFMQCPSCRRVYWRGTHWRAMTKKLESFVNNTKQEGL